MLCGVAAGVSLGQWQLDRREEKLRLIAAQSLAANVEAKALDATLPAPDPEFAAPVQVSGRFVPDRQLISENRFLDGQLGVEIWTPLQLDSGQVLLVNRGWIGLPEYSKQREALLAVGSQRRTVTGLWRSLPESGWHLDADLCGRMQWPLAVNYPRFPELACLFSGPLLQGVLLLDAEADDGFARSWGYAGMPPEKHLGYAVQWFALAATIFIVFIVVNLKNAK